jgi:hypothetical protein
MISNSVEIANKPSLVLMLKAKTGASIRMYVGTGVVTIPFKWNGATSPKIGAQICYDPADNIDWVSYQAKIACT